MALDPSPETAHRTSTETPQATSPDDGPAADARTPGSSVAPTTDETSDDSSDESGLRPSQRPDTPVRLGVALSGGGHRAALFAVGAMLALVDSGLNRDVVSVASVSGGSIANAVFAKECDLTVVEPDRLRNHLRPSLQLFASKGLFLDGPSTAHYLSATLTLLGVFCGSFVAGLAGLASLGRDWNLGLVATLIILGGPVALVLGAPLVKHLMRRLRRAASSPRATSTAGIGGSRNAVWSLGFGIALTGPLVWPTVWAATSAHGWADQLIAAGACVLLPNLIGLGAWGLLARRSIEVERALDTELFDGAKLSLTDRPVHHIFCSTDLRSANHAYLTPRVIYGHTLGFSKPHTAFRLSTAVQTSACLPGAFAPRTFTAEELAAEPLAQEAVTLVDGGVYDNMADQWELGWANRVSELAKARQMAADNGRTPSLLQLTDVQAAPAQALIVVNAGGIFKKREVKYTGPLREVAALARCRDVLYEVSTTTRRRLLFERFTNNSNRNGTLDGTLVHIGQAADGVPRHAADIEHGSDKQRRGATALALTNAISAADDIDWVEVRNANNEIATTLGAIGEDEAVALLQHAYTLTRVNIYINLGLGNLPVPSDTNGVAPFRREAFRQLFH